MQLPMKNLIKFFQALEGLCDAMGPIYNLPRRDAGDKLHVLECFKRSRETNRKEKQRQLQSQRESAE